MAWKIEFGAAAKKELDRIDAEPRRRIIKFLQQRIAPLENPRTVGEGLKGSELGEFWKYRVGHYRIIVNITDAALLILIVRIGHRRDVYKTR